MKNFFIIGAPKTGTTLLARLIDSHPEIACTTELFPFHMKGGKRKLNPNWREKLIQHGFLPEDHKIWRDTLIRQNVNNDWSRTITELVLEIFAGKCNASIVGDKFPWYIGFIDDMLEMFPDAHYIYNVRDPRAVWNSAKNFTRRGRADSLLKLMLAYDKKIEPYLERDNFHSIKFIDLVHVLPLKIMSVAFRDMMKSVFDVDYSNEYLKTDIQYPARFKGIPNSTDHPDYNIVAKWKTQMTKQEIKHVTNMSMDFIKKYGYGE